MKAGNLPSNPSVLAGAELCDGVKDSPSGFREMRGSESDLYLLLSASETLLERVHTACRGFPPGTRCRIFVETYHEAASRLVRKFPEHPRTINLEKADRLASEVIWREAKTMFKETEPLYFLLQDIAVFQERTVQFLLHVDQAILQHVEQVAPMSLDYTPQLLGSYMQLFCNAVRLHLLARGMPRALIIQLHTLLLNLIQVQTMAAVVDPPTRVQLVAFVQAYSDPFAKLQSDFQCISARIGQVLESSVFPALLAFGNRKAVQESRLLEVGHALQLGAVKQVAGHKGWRGLQWLHKMREWAFFAFMACPGESVRPNALAVMQCLLEDTMRMPIYKEYCQWVHPIFQSHVRPTMLLAKYAPLSDRKAHKRSTKNIVEASHEVASSSCMQEHRHRRIMAAKALQDLVTHFSADPSQLAHHREFVLAATAYARDEILWYFLHVNEVPPMGAFKALLVSHQPLKEAATDASVPALLLGMQRAVHLMLQYRTAIQAQVIADMQAACDATIQPGLEGLRAAERAAPNAELLQIIEQLTGIATRIENIQTSEEEAVPIDLADVRGSWEQLAFRLISSAHMVTAADLASAAGDSAFLLSIATVMHHSRFIQDFHTHLREMASLAQLSLCIPKVTAAMRATAGGGPAHLRSTISWLFAFSYLEASPTPDDSPSAQFSSHMQQQPASPKAQEHIAEALTKEWMQLISDKLIDLIKALHQGVAEELERPLCVGETLRTTSSQAHSLLKQNRASSSAAATEDVMLPGKESLPGAAEQRGQLEAQFQAALALMEGLSSAKVTRVTDQLAVCPEELLQDAVRKAVCYMLPKLTFPGKELQQPVELEKDLVCLWQVLQRLGAACGQDFSRAIQEATMAQLAGRGVPTTLSSMASAWIVTEIVLDTQKRGICMAPTRSTFVSTNSKGVGAERYTSPAALAALLRAFGFTIARDLAASTERPLQEAVAALYTILVNHAAMLNDLYDRVKDGTGGLWEACRTAAATLVELFTVLEALQAAARVLFFRQLLSEAVAAVFKERLPAVEACLHAASCHAGSGVQAHVCDFLGLPLPAAALSEPLSSQVADPALVRSILHDGRSDRLNLWRCWPVLLGLTLQSSAWATATYDAALGCPSGRLDGLPACASALPQAVIEACARQEHPCETLQTALDSFAKCASCGLTADREAVSLKTLALKNVWQRIPGSGGALERCHFTETMWRSAHQHACAVAAASAKQ